MSEAFNSFFSNIFPNVGSSISPSDVDPSTFLHVDCRDGFFLNPVTASELSNIILSLKNKSPGYDGICADPIKAAFNNLIPHLLHIINLSFAEGVVPKELKRAQVVPLYKKGSAKEISNYRPISLLPFFSKILEKLVHKRLYEYLSNKNFLSPNQFGFHPGKNTTQALASAIDRISRSFELGTITVGILPDFQKAFDTFHHNILLSKLLKYGISRYTS